VVVAEALAHHAHQHLLHQMALLVVLALLSSN
jgi:hypothetical protein